MSHVARRSGAAFALALLAVVVLAGGLVAAPPAGAATAADAAATLNAERSANGLPAGITVDPQLSADCAAHDHYMAAGHGLTHQEVPGAAGYTTAGAFAASHSVLAEGTGWDNGNPYASAPLHLDQLLAPRLDVIGSADAAGFSCTTTFPGWTRPDPPAPVVYTYPGPGGRIGPSEVANERPFTPVTLAGLTAGRRTGPVLIVLADAPGQSPADNPATLSDATLTGPNGPVAVRTVDGSTAIPGGGTLAPYISPGGFIIPVSPLRTGRMYHAHVRVSFAGLTLTRSWTFLARGGDPGSTLRARGAILVFTSSSSAPIHLTFTRNGGGSSRPRTLAPGHSLNPHLSPGVWQVCGHQSASSGFQAYSGCLMLTVTGRSRLSIGSPAIRGARLVFPLRLSHVLLGRSALLTRTPLRRQCTAGTCTTVSGTPIEKTITLTRRVSIRLPAVGHGITLELRVGAFDDRGSPWSSVQATYTWERR